MQDTREKIELLCMAAELVLESGGETYRVEETALRMAKGFGLRQVNVAALPTSIFIEVDGVARVRRRKPLMVPLLMPEVGSAGSSVTSPL